MDVVFRVVNGFPWLPLATRKARGMIKKDTMYIALVGTAQLQVRTESFGFHSSSME